jgi:hypothetical protein
VVTVTISGAFGRAIGVFRSCVLQLGEPGGEEFAFHGVVGQVQGLVVGGGGLGVAVQACRNSARAAGR